MAISTVWKAHSFTIDDGTPVTVPAVTQAGITNDVNVLKEPTVGSVYPQAATAQFRAVTADFSSHAVTTVLDKIPLSGLCFTNAYLYLAQYDCSGIKSGSVHRRYHLRKGAIALRNMQVDHQANAIIGLAVRGVYDGTNAPVTYSDNVALPTLSDYNDRWTMHTFSLASQAITGKKSINVDFNPTITTEGADSEDYDSFASIDRVEPVVQVRGIDPTWYDTGTFNLDATAVTHANTAWVFRKRDTADLTAEHIQFTAAGKVTWPTLVDANGLGNAETIFQLDSIEDASGNDPIKWNTAYSIP